MDVLWFRMSRKQSDNTDTFGHIEAGKLMVMLDRGDYWQCAYVIPKGGIEQVKSEGLETFRKRVVEMSPFLADRVGELESWDDVKLLSVTVDRLRKWWRPGLICIGDAAHAMSPISVGINMAVQDAVAAANRLASPLRSSKLRTMICGLSRTAAPSLSALHSGCSSPSRGGSLAAFSKANGRRNHRCFSSSSGFCRLCVAFRLG